MNSSTIAAHAITGTHRFARDHFLTRDKPLGIITQIDINIAALDAFDLTHDQRAFTIGIGVDDLAALGLAHLLYDDLLGGLCRDAAKFDRFDLLFDEIAELNLGLIDLRRFQGNLAQRLFETVFAGFDDFPAAVGIVVTGLTVDINAHFDILLMFLTRRRRQGCLDRFKYYFAIHSLFVGDGIRY